MPLAPLQTLSIAGTLMLISLSGQAQESDQQMMMSNMHAQLAKLGGTMHATAKVCEDYSDEKLAEHKEQQKTQSIQNGMDAASFDKAFDAGADEAEAKWKAIPAAELQARCDEFRQEMEGMAQQFMR